MSELLAWDFADPFVMDVDVPADAIDRLGHVNNARYLVWLEACAWQHSEHLGVGWDDYERLNCAVVAHRHEVDYLKASFAGETLRVGTWCSGNDGKLRFRRHYQIMRPADGACVVRAVTHWICVDLQSGRPRRMPPEFVRGYPSIADAPPFP